MPLLNYFKLVCLYDMSTYAFFNKSKLAIHCLVCMYTCINLISLMIFISFRFVLCISVKGACVSVLCFYYNSVFRNLLSNVYGLCSK